MKTDTAVKIGNHAAAVAATTQVKRRENKLVIDDKWHQRIHSIVTANRQMDVNSQGT